MKGKKSMKRILIGLVLFIILLGGAYIVLSNTMTDWLNACEGYGNLNVMEMDADAQSNDFNFIFNINKNQDFKIAGDLLITKGTVKVSYSLDGKLLSEEVYSKGNHTLESESYSDMDGELDIICEVSDDAEGSYKLSVYTRESLFQKLVSRVHDDND